MASILIDDTKVARVLTAMAAKADNLEPMFDEWGHALVTDTLGRFATETDPDGRPWAPLAISTKARKAKKGRTRILYFDGFLRESITHRANRTELQVGTPMAYGATHQFGAVIERHAHTKVGSYRRWRDVTVGRDDGSTYTAKRFAKASHKKISMMARTVIGAGTTTIPARPFLGLSVAGLDAGQRIARRYVAPEGGA